MAVDRRRAHGGGRGVALILCSGTLGTIPFREKVDAALAAGYTGISIYAREHEPGLRVDGLSVAEVDGPMGWLPGQPGPEPERVIDIAHALDARSLTVIEVTGEAPDVGRAADAFAALCRAAAPLLVHIEPFPFSGIPSLTAAGAIVERAGEPNGGLLLDTWHLFRGPDAGVVSHADLVVALQVSDVADEPWPSVREETMHGRLVPGRRTMSVIEQVPGVPVEIEVFNDELFALPPAAAARRAFGALSPTG